LRLEEKALELKHLDELSNLCIWMGPAYFEDYMAKRLEHGNDSFYELIGCYDCTGHDDVCKYYNSEAKLIARYAEMNKVGAENS